MVRKRSGVEETATHNTKVSDSGYSNSCSNSQSQRSSGSSKSRHSTSSGSGSGSSGYCGRTPPLNINDGNNQSKRKDKEHKKKKSKSSSNSVQQLPTEEPNNKPQPQEETTVQNDNQPMETSVSQPISNEALQIAALSQTLTTMKKLKYREMSPDENKESPIQGSAEPKIEINPEQLGAGIKPEQLEGCQIGPILYSDHYRGHYRVRYCAEPKIEYKNRDFKSPTLPYKQISVLLPGSLQDDELKIVVSMNDGVVVYTDGLTAILGYPKEMWIGRSLIDFVQPKHRAIFAGHITSAIANLRPGWNTTGPKNIFFCCLRMYRGLKSSGFNIGDKNVSYLPCQLTLSFKELTSANESSAKEYLIITATLVKCAYKYPDETIISPKFMTRHSANCQLNHVDPEVTAYFGYLPQDMLGRSVLEFYHPEDLHFLKEVYEAVMKEQGHLFRSKPYRFRCQNGQYALIETEISSFINPWSRKLEFIIGQHTVLRGPLNPDVTTPVNDPEPLQISTEILKETKIVQEEIKCLLNETVIRTSESAKQQVSKRCKDLAVFMESLMDEITKPPELKVYVPTEEQSFSERDSVTLGEISPHHDYYDSKSSSETPPSYNQLNYNENIQRFFESKPKTTVTDESTQNKSENVNAEEGKISSVINSTISKSGGSGTRLWQSTESKGNSGETTPNTSSNTVQRYKPAALTEQLLIRHNEDMEKQMVQKHREMRCKSDRDSKTKDSQKEKDLTKVCYNGQEDQVCCKGQSSGHHGLKRSSSHSWEDEPYKTIKASHNASGLLLGNKVSSSGIPVGQGTSGCANPTTGPGKNQPSLWPPFSVSLTPVKSSRHEYTHPTFASALMPIYYVRPDGSATAPYQQNPYLTQQLQYVPGMVYHPVMFGTPPMMYSPLTMYPPPMYPNTNNHQPQQQNRQSPQNAPTLNADMGSTPLCSTAAPQMQQDLNYKSRKTPADRVPPANQYKPSMQQEASAESVENSESYEDSSYQSFFFSVVKTDKSDDSMKSSSEPEKPEDSTWASQSSQKIRPFKKIAPWVEGIDVTPELLLKYQLTERRLEDVLKEDLVQLKEIHQPSLVNDQLNQMYSDLELEGLSRQLTLEEPMTTSSDSSCDESYPTVSTADASKRKRRQLIDYDKLTILFEEDAPLPPPVSA